MADVFHSDDGCFYQALLALNKLVLVRLVVEKTAVKAEQPVEWLKGDQPSEWEWVVWPVRGPWEEPDAAVKGRERSLAAAKRQAFDAGISLLADITRDRAVYLGAFEAAQEVRDFLSAEPGRGYSPRMM